MNVKKVLKKLRKPLLEGLVLTILLAGVVVGLSFAVSNTGSAKISKRSLEIRINLAGDYLVGAVNDDGSFIYEYDPVRDVDEGGYNILRHAGTVYAMFELHDTFPRQDILVSGEKAIDYLVQQMKTCGDALCLVEGREVKLGGNGLAMLALIQYSESTNTRLHDETIHQLAEWIMSVQDNDGQFTVHKASYPSMRREGFLSTYYPGEAIYALARTCQLLKTDTYCDSAERGADWIITVRDEGLGIDQLPHDHWFLYGLKELYTLTGDTLYSEQSYNIANTIMNDQITESTDNPFWIGGFNEPPRSAPTATRMEGLAAAYQTGKTSTQYKRNMKQSLKLGINLLEQLQVTPELLSVPTINLTEQSVGGFIRGFGKQDIRIDYVQHALSAMLGYYQNFK